MALSPNSAQSREFTELRNHLKWLDEERRKTARKLGEMEQRIAQQGRDITEREKRIHELEWQLAQVSERIEQMPEAGTGSSGQEQRLQDLEWHMSNINAQLVRLPKLDEELARFREDLSRNTVDIENRLLAQQAETAQQLESNVYSRLHDDISQSAAGYDERLAAVQNELLDRIAITEGGLNEQSERTVAVAVAGVTDRIDAQVAAAIQELQISSTTREQLISETIQEMQLTAAAQEAQLAASLEEVQRVVLSQHDNQASVLERLAALEGVGGSHPEALVELQAIVHENEQRTGQQLAELAALVTATQASQKLFDETLAELKMDDGSLAAVARIEQELELRQSEELRLANLIGVQESKVERNNALIEEMNRVVAQMQSQAAEFGAGLAELRDQFHELDATWKPALMEASGKIVPLTERLNTISNSVTKSEANLQTLAAAQTEMRDSLTSVSDEVRQTRTDLTSQVDNWQVTIDEHKETIERFSQQWLTLSNQYKEARMAVQNFAHWQKQLEQQKREASEMLRVESNRMQSRWEGFLLEIQEQLKNVDLDLAQKWQAFELENEQRWVASRRNEQVWREELANVDDLIVKLQQDSRNLIWRVQAAQADAIKKWPRLLLEEVEKAVELNPNRRLQQSATTSARSDMSVADAIEQGLIKVDYDDDLSTGNQ